MNNKTGLIMSYFFFRQIMFVGVLLMSAFAHSAHAQSSDTSAGRPGVLVTPTRAVLEGRVRSAEISIANNGTRAGFYTISLINKRMLENGSLEDVVEAQEGEQFADQMIRISPRRVTLEPGKHQMIRLLTRKPKGLKEGEYRSHLNISVTPLEDAKEKVAETSDDEKDENLSIQIKANFGVTIPVIVRHGTLEAAAKINKIGTYYAEEEKKHHVTIDMTRTGDRSLYGDLRITHIADSGIETVLKNMLGVAVYIPNTTRVFDVDLEHVDKVSLSSGSLEVIYKAKKEENSIIYAKERVKL
jgi:P pilus assembly chaperone PapD